MELENLLNIGEFGEIRFSREEEGKEAFLNYKNQRWKTQIPSWGVRSFLGKRLGQKKANFPQR